MMTPRKDSLWELIAGPTIWSVYFLVAYVAAAIVCAKGGDMDSLRIAILGLAVAALGAIGFAGFDAWRRWRRGHEAAPPHDDDTAMSRHQFLALATLLLCGLSFVATLYVALPAAIFASCR
ncbi:MAG TPA: hypothetical protein VIS03_13415 [Kiloniellaceae bacterium]